MNSASCLLLCPLTYIICCKDRSLCRMLHGGCQLRAHILHPPQLLRNIWLWLPRWWSLECLAAWGEQAGCRRKPLSYARNLDAFRIYWSVGLDAFNTNECFSSVKGMPSVCNLAVQKAESPNPISLVITGTSRELLVNLLCVYHDYCFHQGSLCRPMLNQTWSRQARGLNS